MLAIKALTAVIVRPSAQLRTGADDPVLRVLAIIGSGDYWIPAFAGMTTAFGGISG